MTTYIGMEIPGFGIATFTSDDMSYAIETLLPSSLKDLRIKVANSVWDKAELPDYLKNGDVTELLAIWCDANRPCSVRFSYDDFKG